MIVGKEEKSYEVFTQSYARVAGSNPPPNCQVIKGTSFEVKDSSGILEIKKGDDVVACFAPHVWISCVVTTDEE